MKASLRKMRLMTNNKLASYLCQNTSCETCPANNSKNDLECQKALVEWLGQQKAK